jgi:hypothetical protein
MSPHFPWRKRNRPMEKEWIPVMRRNDRRDASLRLCGERSPLHLPDIVVIIGVSLPPTMSWHKRQQKPG